MKMLVESLKRMYKKGTLTEEQIDPVLVYNIEELVPLNAGLKPRDTLHLIHSSAGMSKASSTHLRYFYTERRHNGSNDQLFSEHIGESVRMKAAGGIKSFEDAEEFLRLGAKRLGTSRIDLHSGGIFPGAVAATVYRQSSGSRTRAAFAG